MIGVTVTAMILTPQGQFVEVPTHELAPDGLRALRIRIPAAKWVHANISVREFIQAAISMAAPDLELGWFGINPPDPETGKPELRPVFQARDSAGNVMGLVDVYLVEKQDG